MVNPSPVKKVIWVMNLGRKVFNYIKLKFNYLFLPSKSTDRLTFYHDEFSNMIYVYNKILLHKNYHPFYL